MDFPNFEHADALDLSGNFIIAIGPSLRAEEFSKGGNGPVKLQTSTPARTEGAPAIRHKGCDKTPNNTIHQAMREYAVALVKENYEDFGLSFAAEMLAEYHGFMVSRETLRKWLTDDGLWLSRKSTHNLVTK